MSLPKDLSLRKIKSAKLEELQELAKSLREEICQVAGKNGGHLAGNLGVVELTLALHYVFDSPRDQIVFDVGHQSYTHKIITDRAGKFSTLREKNGLSGFTLPSESPHDANVAGHAGNAISVATGLSFAEPQHTKIAVVGDGCLLNGMSVEALNHLATSEQDVLIVINDNDFSIDRCTGAIARRDGYQQLVESFDLPYVGPVDGHNLLELIGKLKQLKDYKRPRVLHVKTKKGCGLDKCEKDPIQTHFYLEGVKNPEKLKLQELVEQAVERLAEKDERIRVITPAMAQGAGLSNFAKKYPERFFDVGIAESHALGLAAGLASRGKRPIVHFYASFLQRAYDQLIHDVAIPGLPVTILLDRAGLIGQDGVTHQGTLALSFLNLVPNCTILGPGNAQELVSSLKMAQELATPVVIAYPKEEIARQEVEKLDWEQKLENAWVRQNPQAKVLVLTTGWLRQEVEKINPEVQFAHFHVPLVKPFKRSILTDLAKKYKHVLTIEENSQIGGFGATIRANLDDSSVLVKNLAIADEFVPHASREEQLASFGLTAAQIAKTITEMVTK